MVTARLIVQHIKDMFMQYSYIAPRNVVTITVYVSRYAIREAPLCPGAASVDEAHEANVPACPCAKLLSLNEDG